MVAFPMSMLLTMFSLPSPLSMLPLLPPQASPGLPMGAGNGEEVPKGAHAEQDGQVVRNGQAVHAHAGPHGQEGGEQNLRGGQGEGEDFEHILLALLLQAKRWYS